MAATTVEGAPRSVEAGDAARQLRLAVAARKCWVCGCLRHALDTIERAIPAAAGAEELTASVAEARARILPQRYDCLGCEVCYPAVALNVLGSAIEGRGEAACPTVAVGERPGWPPLPGSYHVLRYRAPAAVCTLNDDELAESIAQAAVPGVAIVGTLHTENLGIERLARNVLTNPSIRFVIVCGDDGRQRIGHLPGQSLVALARNGIDERQRIIGAKGKRPVLRNLDSATIIHFRKTVEMIDLIGVADLKEVNAAVQRCAERDPGPAEAFSSSRVVVPTIGYVPEKMVSDPAGYFVVFVDRTRKLLCLEHYANTGALTSVIEGKTAAELYMPAVDRQLLSRLDHAAYLGRELARAEHALSSGQAYVQDGAPEKSISAACGCHDAAR